ncbi:hypothetical protein PENTCL1PPCAC_29836, partial [Pristionchus entomophagus]
SQEPPKKRSDLQSLRGIAICSVFLFHIRQDIFINGFLGVDVFFVLSGFLISSILSRHQKLSFEHIKNFYFRRFKRIVPLYVTVLLACMISALLIFAKVDAENEQRSFLWSFFFARNIQQIKNSRDYWQQGSASHRSLLNHAWSLGVEIQYYLVAPFIYAFICLLKTRTLRIVSYVCISTASLLLYLISDNTTHFNSPVCRWWQFMLGSIASEVAGGSVMSSQPVTEEKEALLEQQPAQDKDALLEMQQDLEVTNTEYSVIVSQSLRTSIVIVLVLYLVSPFSFGERIGAIGVSLMVAGLIATCDDASILLLSSRSMAYIGDISYALYLVHWPVIVFFTYHIENTKLDSWESVIFVVLITILFTLFAHFTIEKWSLRKGYIPSAVYVGVIYTVMAIILHNTALISDMVLSHRFNSLSRIEIETTPGHKMNFTRDEIR